MCCQMFTEKLLVSSGEEVVEVPLTAALPAPCLHFDPFLNFGAVVVDQSGKSGQARPAQVRGYLRREGRRPPVCMPPPIYLPLSPYSSGQGGGGHQHGATGGHLQGDI